MSLGPECTKKNAAQALKSSPFTEGSQHENGNYNSRSRNMQWKPYKWAAGSHERGANHPADLETGRGWYLNWVIRNKSSSRGGYRTDFWCLHKEYFTIQTFFNFLLTVVRILHLPMYLHDGDTRVCVFWLFPSFGMFLDSNWFFRKQRKVHDWGRE